MGYSAFVLPRPSGIAYQFGYSLWSGQVTSYGLNDEGALKAAGWFDYIPPVYPLNFAKLATRTTLINVNIHGNTNRFTARNGTGTYTIPIIQDHLTGLEWYRSLLGGDTWQNAIDACVALTIDSSTGWYLPPIKVLQTIMDYASTGSGTYFPSPFLNGVNIYSSSVMGQTTSQAWTASSGQIASVVRASVSRNYYAVRRFI